LGIWGLQSGVEATLVPRDALLSRVSDSLWT
jgi:hypothetical protein